MEVNGLMHSDKTVLILDLRGSDSLSEKEIRLIEMLMTVKKSCGQVCDTTLKGFHSHFIGYLITLASEYSLTLQGKYHCMADLLL